MRGLVLVSLLAIAQPALAQTQAPAEASSAAPDSTQPPSTPLRLFPIGPIPLAPLPRNKLLHCCNAKGAAVGFAIGAGLGIAMVHSLCDSSDCSSAYFGAATFFGGLGAGIGGLVRSPSIKQPTMFPTGTRVAVAPVVSRKEKGGAVAVRF